MLPTQKYLLILVWGCKTSSLWLICIKSVHYIASKSAIIWIQISKSSVIDLYYIILRMHPPLHQHCYHIFLSCQGHSPWTSSNSLIKIFCFVAVLTVNVDSIDWEFQEVEQWLLETWGKHCSSNICINC